MQEIEIREFSPANEDLLHAIGRLRVQAWETAAPEAAEMEIWLDEYDRSSRHWVALHEGAPVAAARLSIHANLSEVPDAESYQGVIDNPSATRIASFNRLVVHPSFRRLGLSRRLDLIRLEVAEEMGCEGAILSTATGPHRIRQLVALGFEFLGYGPHFSKPPLCHLPRPAVLFCRFPRQNRVHRLDRTET